MAHKDGNKEISYNFSRIEPGETQKELFSNGVEITLRQLPEQAPKDREFAYEVVMNGWYDIFVRDLMNLDMEALRQVLARLNHTKPGNIILPLRYLR